MTTIKTMPPENDHGHSSFDWSLNPPRYILLELYESIVTHYIMFQLSTLLSEIYNKTLLINLNKK